MSKWIAGILTFLLIFALLFAFSPEIRGVFNRKAYEVQKVDDATNYATLKKIEDTALNMITNYGSDKLFYEQYVNSAKPEEQSWAMQAKARANRTAVMYNVYITENHYLWKDGLPDNLRIKLPTIE
jgi:hypothetical protein